MNFSIVCLIGIFSTTPFGLAFLLAPEATSSIYGVADWNAGTSTIARLFGAVLLYVAGTCYAIKDTADPVIQHRTSRIFSIVSAAALLVSVQSILSGATNAIMWSTAAIYVFFTFAWGNIGLPKKT